MARLHILIDACVEAIVRYHEKKIPETVKPDEAPLPVAPRLSLLPRDEMITELNTLIEKATEADATRRPLFKYLLDGIAKLKTIAENEEPHEDDEANIAQFIQFTLDMQTLLQTQQGYQIPVNCNGEAINLNGLVRSLLMGYSWCISGDILQDTLFPALGLSRSSDAAKIAKAITSIVAEHYQNQAREKLVKELTSTVTDVREVQTTLHLELAALSEINAKITDEVASLRTELSILHKVLEQQAVHAHPVSRDESRHTGAPKQKPTKPNMYSGAYRAPTASPIAEHLSGPSSPKITVDSRRAWAQFRFSMGAPDAAKSKEPVVVVMAGKKL